MVEEVIEQGPLSPTIGAFESLQSHSNSLRRARPPNIIIGDRDRVPLRAEPRAEPQPERLSKRESRVGLRSLFGRTRAAKDKDGNDMECPALLRESSKPGGIRASLAEISNWPYGQQSSRSDISLASPPPPSSSRSGSSSGLQNHPSNPRSRQHSLGKSKALPTGPEAIPGAWVPAPLFQVYPQALKHATLPACTASVDALLRLSGHRSSLVPPEDSVSEDAGEKKDVKSKKLHQRSAGSRSILDWTSKTYVLVTSGYLLQYAADGPFDRLPEKILRLSKDSAAFASDLIPGRHWVVQIVSSSDGNGAPATESKSFISKLALRGPEKRHVSTILMVFEGAEDMDNWLAILRREIAELGGKKQLTETGELKKDDTIGQLKSKPSQRTIIVRDPERFSTLVQQDFSWTNKNALKERDHGLPPIPSAELTPEFPLDDVSTTESHYSSDGQHLDSLRESNNRLSYNSSGQRTFITSANSSPACSPTRVSFSSHHDDPKACPPIPETHPEVRLRPNAQAIASRRQSMQTVMSGFDAQLESSSRPHSIISNGTDHSETARQSVPNFSKRFSGLRSGSVDLTLDQIPAPAPVAELEPATKSLRKPPPTSLVMSRPLSTVMDMPTPRTPLSPYSTRNISSIQNYNLGADSLSPASIASTRGSDGGKPQAQTNPHPKERRLSSSQTPSDSRTAPRRFVSMSSLRTRTDHSAEPASEAPRFILSSSIANRKAQFESTSNARQEPPRSFSSIGTYGSDERLTRATSIKGPSYKRSTFLAGEPSLRRPRHSFAYANEAAHQTHDRLSSSPEHSARPEFQPPPSSTSDQFLNVDLQAKSLIGRRSMPQLVVDGPPLAPPPTRALPPIPKRH